MGEISFVWEGGMWLGKKGRINNCVVKEIFKISFRLKHKHVTEIC